MLKFSKVGLLLAVVAFSGLLASSASAGEWHTNGVKSFHSTDAGVSRLAIHTATGPTLVSCPTSTGFGTINGPTSTALPWLSAATVTPVFGGGGPTCTVSGAGGYSVACATAELRANSYVGGTTIGSAGGGVTTGLITNIDCRLSIGANTCSTITGTVPAHYINPNPIASGTGQLTVTSTGQLLEVHKITAGCAAVPNGTATFGKPDAGSGVTDITFLVHGPNAPFIYRTP